MSSEFNNRQINRSSCDYSNLSSYNQDTTSGLYGLPMYSSGPYNPGIPSMSVQVIPQFSAPGYSALQHNEQGQQCGGYFSVGSAYPGASSGNCTQFATRKCN